VPGVTSASDTPAVDPVLHLVPPAGGWHAWTAARELDPCVQSTRRALGLPERGPLVMTGHQAGLWHAGILAKYLAADALARLAPAGAWSHVVVDQDINDAGALAVPTSDLRRAAIRLAPRSVGRVTAMQPASARTGAMPPNVHPAVAARVAEIIALVPAAASAPDLPAQLEAMLRALCEPLFALPRGVRATRLADTEGFRVLLGAIADDPVACIEHYNAAVATAPRARLAPLRVLGGRVELPLWRIDPDTGTRQPVFSDSLAGLPSNQLAPRALLLSAFLRLFVCDLFIHGTGGGLYDQATDAWLARWRPAWRPCPGAVVSATLALPLAAPGRLPTPDAIAKARWTAHAARHDPSRLGDVSASRIRASLLDRIREAKASGGDARGAYVALHAMLDEVRARHRADLDALDARASTLEAAGEASRVAHDRTWSFALHAQPSLDSLQTLIRRELGAGDRPVSPWPHAARRA
jgi:hypothetical protein